MVDENLSRVTLFLDTGNPSIIIVLDTNHDNHLAKAEPFTEVSDNAEALPVRRGRPRSHKLKITPGELPDWSPFSTEEKSDIMASLLADDELSEQLAKMRSEGGESNADVIDGDHVGMFLDLLSSVERMVIPAMVARKTKGKFVIPPAIAEVAFKFDGEKREQLITMGVEAGNKSLPPKVKKIISKVAGSGTKFAYNVVKHMETQMKSAVMMTIAYHQQHGAPQPPAVAAAPSPINQKRPSKTPPPRPNGNPSPDANPPEKFPAEGQTV